MGRRHPAPPATQYGHVQPVHFLPGSHPRWACGRRSHLYDTQPSRRRARTAKERQGMGAFFQYTIIGLTVGSFYALVALGYTIVYGIIRLINFAQGDLSMIGAFIGWTLLVSLGLEHLPLYLALVVAFVVPMLGTAVVNLAIL